LWGNVISSRGPPWEVRKDKTMTTPVPSPHFCIYPQNYGRTCSHIETKRIIQVTKQSGQKLLNPTEYDATIKRKILLLCRTDTAQHVSGITMPIMRSPIKCRCSHWFQYKCGGGSVLSRGRPRLRTLPPPHSYGNQRLQGQFDGLLMMGILIPETC